MTDKTIVHFIPILTTLISVIFAAKIYRRYRVRGGGNHLLWWSFGVLIFGLGTFFESWITLLGWNAFVFKSWYISGALLGGAPLAQGTVWLLLKPTTARWLTIALIVGLGYTPARKFSMVLALVVVTLVGMGFTAVLGESVFVTVGNIASIPRYLPRPALPDPGSPARPQIKP